MQDIATINRKNKYLKKQLQQNHKNEIFVK
uniref:Uncharacterized protein n=1 Tax=viral metagenome TaxID=1070528 RepID=A0A6C0CC27_9ZZZZ